MLYIQTFQFPDTKYAVLYLCIIQAPYQCFEERRGTGDSGNVMVCPLLTIGEPIKKKVYISEMT